MQRLVGSLVLLAVAVVVARGEIRLFVTTSSAGFGLDSPANAFQPTFSTVDDQDNNYNAYDYTNGHFRCSSFPPTDAPGGTPDSPVEIVPGDWAYIWLQFRNEPKNAHVNGIEVALRLNHVPAPLVPTYYVMNDMQGATPVKRWNGPATAPDYAEWHENPQVMVAITAHGLTNFGNDVPWNLYQGASHIALLGAVPVPADGQTYELTWSTSIIDPPLNPAYFRCVPEPAALVVLGLLGLMVRQRASASPFAASQGGVVDGLCEPD